MNKPTLGFPSRTGAVMALRSQGHSTKAIALKIGITPSTVVALEHSACHSQERRRRRRPPEENGRTVVFPLDILKSLRRHAARRGIHVNELARRIVEHVVDDGLIDAVLDDAPEFEEARRA